MTNLLEWAQTKDFVQVWKGAFADGRELVAPFDGPVRKPHTDAKRCSHWLQVREPCEGIRLIAVEFPFAYGPARLYLRVWAYQPGGDAAYEAMIARPFQFAGTDVSRFEGESPRDGWLGYLEANDAKIRGIRHTFWLADLEELPPDDVISVLRKVVVAFCEYVAMASKQQPSSIVTEPPSLGDKEPPLDSPEAAASLLTEFDSIDDDQRFQDEPPPVRLALRNARIGQGAYRERMLKLWGRRCAVTGCAVEEVLVASHARPFARCETAFQCLDEFNGLLLSANLDRLFDRGLIAFQNDGALLINAAAGVADLVAGNCLREVHPQHAPYLTWHRRHFGFE